MFKTAGILAIAFAASAGAMIVGLATPACSAELRVRVTHQPATVAGIRSEPSAAPFYDNRAPVVLKRAPAVAYRVDEAPANGCEGQGGFREASGPYRGRCFGY